jgi:hypothetical protein
MTTAGSSMRRWQKNRNVSLESGTGNKVSREVPWFIGIGAAVCNVWSMPTGRLCGSRISHYFRKNRLQRHVDFSPFRAFAFVRP